MTYIKQSDDTIVWSGLRQTSAFHKGEVLVAEAKGSGRQLVRSAGQEVQLLGSSIANVKGNSALTQRVDLGGILKRYNLAGEVVVTEDVATTTLTSVVRGGRDGQRTSLSRQHGIVVLVLLLLLLLLVVVVRGGWAGLVHVLAAVVDSIWVVESSVGLGKLRSHILTRACGLVVVFSRIRSLHSLSVGSHGGHRVLRQMRGLLASVFGSVLRVGDVLFVLGGIS